MAGNSIWCFLQGVDESFPVNVKGIETIKDLRDLVLCQQKKFIRNINVDKYNIFQIFIPIDDIAEFGKLRQNPTEIERVKLEDSQEISAIFETNDTHIQVFIGKVTPPTLKEVLEKTVSTPIIQKLDQTMSELVKQNQELIKLISARRTKSVQQGKELDEICKTRVLRVGDALRFEKIYETLADIEIRRSFTVTSINNETYTPTVNNSDQGANIQLVVNSLSLLEREIISLDVRQEITDRITGGNRNNFINDLQDYNRRTDTGRRDKIDQLVSNPNLTDTELIDGILKIQLAKTHPERNFYFNILNVEMKVSEYIDRYFYTWK